MKVVALVSGGKDSCYNMMKCVEHGHEIVALANLHPVQEEKQELDSFCFQTVGHNMISMIAEAMELPLYRRPFTGRSVVREMQYKPTQEDEVEDLFALLQSVKQSHPDIQAVASGAILSNYQRLRVENVCSRLGLISLAYLWQRDQAELLDEMISAKIHAILIKVASYGIYPRRHLGRHLAELRDEFHRLNGEVQFAVCGEGGEYETLTLDCPLFARKIVVDEAEVVETDERGEVGHLLIRSAHLADKEQSSSQIERASVSAESKSAAIKGSETCDQEIQLRQMEWTCNADGKCDPNAPLVSYKRRGGYLHVSGVTGVINGQVSTPAEQAGLMMKRLIRPVLENGGDSSDVVFVHLYLSDMTQFQAINNIYCKSFGLNPPSRACVEVAQLPHGAFCMADCSAHLGSGRSVGDTRQPIPRSVLHVQSISEWAPTCIGPYSQANTLAGVHFQAGQIPLDPATMQLVGGDLTRQSQQALANCAAVLKCCSTSFENLLCCVVYVSQQHWNDGTYPLVRSCIGDAARAQLLDALRNERRHESVVGSDSDSDDEQDEAATPVQCGGTSLDHRLQVIVVPRLPRDAAVEYQLTALTNTRAQNAKLQICSSDMSTNQNCFRVQTAGVALPGSLCMGVTRVWCGGVCAGSGDLEMPHADLSTLLRSCYESCSQFLTRGSSSWQEAVHLDVLFDVAALPEASTLLEVAERELISVCGEVAPPSLSVIGMVGLDSGASPAGDSADLGRCIMHCCVTVIGFEDLSS